MLMEANLADFRQLDINLFTTLPKKLRDSLTNHVLSVRLNTVIDGKKDYLKSIGQRDAPDSLSAAGKCYYDQLVKENADEMVSADMNVVFGALKLFIKVNEHW